MFKRTLLAVVGVAALLASGFVGSECAEAAPPGQPNDWQRFYHYPYVYYPHNFQKQPESYNSMYYRYGQERRIPVYNKDWYNFYPAKKPYHSGNHYTLDVF
ncbi:hypothetical protein SH668x_003584 [Planctomicrobium sp. SH668]|uniref:hypothetical protein n=1 Tax=Planctomicrobium sp. SH668 TaxID=3448126 RepID=UPI003F5CA9F8